MPALSEGLVIAAGANEELIRVTQLPVIEERLRAVKAEVERVTGEAAAMACTEDTARAVKAKRAELTKLFETAETQRKAAKAVIMEPYERLHAVYKDCITEPFKAADAALKAKIAEVETVQKDACEARCREYFAELCAVHGVPWLQYEQAGLKISLTEAKKKTPSGHFQTLNDFVARVACDVDAIAKGEFSGEIMVEYRKTLVYARAVSTVMERHKQIEAEKQAAQAREEAQKRQAEAVARVEAAAPPVPVEAAKPTEKVFSRFTFTCVDVTRAQLIKVREFMKQEGIRYE